MTVDTSRYPTRERFFAHRFCRLLAKTCAAQELGSLTCWLLTVIAHTEDAKRYTGGVTFFNEQLMPLLGIRKWATLAKIRKAAVDAGWLHFQSRGSRKPGVYWVTIPADVADLPDSPVDETSPPRNGYDRGEAEQGTPPQKGYVRGDDRGDDRGEPPYHNPNPFPNGHGGNGSVKVGWKGRRIAPGEFGDPSAIEGRFREAVSKGWIDDTPAARLQFHTLAVYVSRQTQRQDGKTIRSPGAVFTHAVKAASWKGSDGDEDTARDNIRQLDRAAAPPPSEDVNQLAGKLSVEPPKEYEDGPVC